jgi:hypothetical protein
VHGGSTYASKPPSTYSDPLYAQASPFSGPAYNNLVPPNKPEPMPLYDRASGTPNLGYMDVGAEETNKEEDGIQTELFS